MSRARSSQTLDCERSHRLPAAATPPAVGAFVTGLLVWVYREPRTPQVITARITAGQSGSPPLGAFGLGAALASFLAVMMQFTIGGPSGAKALKLARAKYGTGYDYCGTAMRSSGGRHSAAVSAFNRDSERTVHVEWDE